MLMNQQSQLTRLFPASVKNFFQISKTESIKCTVIYILLLNESCRRQASTVKGDCKGRQCKHKTTIEIQ